MKMLVVTALVHHCMARYVNSEGVVTEKGRVAANIQSADELVLTELIYSGGFRVCTHTQSPILSAHLLTGCRLR
jgi:superfamily II RNA helicase